LDAKHVTWVRMDANGNFLTGVFNVRNVYFIMGGDWDVHVTLTDALKACKKLRRLK
jgi:hypothetical protein